MKSLARQAPANVDASTHGEKSDSLLRVIRSGRAFFHPRAELLRAARAGGLPGLAIHDDCIEIPADLWYFLREAMQRLLFPYQLPYAGELADEHPQWDRELFVFQLLETAARIWMDPKSFIEGSSTRDDQLSLLSSLMQIWTTSPGKSAHGSSNIVARVIQNTGAGPRSSGIGMIEGVLVVHIDNHVGRMLHHDVLTSQLPGPKRQGNLASNWLAAEHDGEFSIMLRDNRSMKTERLDGWRHWGVGPILTTGPIFVGYSNGRSSADQMKAIRHLFNDIYELEPYPFGQSPDERTAHERLELIAALDDIENAFKALS